MRQLALLFLPVSALLLERPALAESPNSTSRDDDGPATGLAPAAKGPKGLELGIRTGFALPLGNSDGAHAGLPGDPLNTDVANMVPIWVDAGYRFIPSLFAGAYFTYGFGSVPSNAQPYCSVPDQGCTISDLRLGADVQFHVLPASRFDPWLGLGFGFEWLKANWAKTGSRGAPVLGGLNTGDLGIRSELSGWEFVNLQAGLDFHPGAWLGLGPFLMLSFAQFDGYAQNLYSQSIDKKSLHEWFLFGVRGVFDPMSYSPPSYVNKTLQWSN